ncbi:MAG: Z1 domain-containing protein [Candidatus Acidiferrales bacterium]
MGFYDIIAAKRGDSAELKECTEKTVASLEQQETSSSKPGILLGKIQSGKTRAYLGVAGLAFDHGYDIVVILTKGTRSLARQTLKRVREDFRLFLESDQAQVFDIMNLPDNLTPYELNQKIIFVVKKEDDNLRRLLKAFEVQYPILKNKRILIIDDEADTASLSFRRSQGQVDPGVISKQIDHLRGISQGSGFLQVTATPYSLYLQPDDEVLRNGASLFKPKRPAFTTILPIHPGYVGGDHYFEKSTDPTSPAYFFFEKVPEDEREALKLEDRRRLKIENVLTETNSAVLVQAIMNFITGGTIRRIQAASAGQTTEKYSFLFHTESARQSHDWQEKVASKINQNLIAAAQGNDPIFDNLVHAAYHDLKRSIEIAGTPLPAFDAVREEVKKSLLEGHLMITKVNSGNDIEALLNDDGQLRLRTPLNLFIGGQILDRGITITNLIGFYYGRNPRRFQQDTVLQHSRMYGSRPKDDLPVTRFYAPPHIYQTMRNIHEFDSALREAFLTKAHEQGVYFIQRDAADRLVPCSPNKLLFSRLTTIRPGRRVLPVDFQTVSKTAGKKLLDDIDKRIRTLCNGALGTTVQIQASDAMSLLKHCYLLLEFNDPEDEQAKAQIAILEHFSQNAPSGKDRGKVWLLTAVDRDVARYRESGRFSDAPDTKQQADEAKALAVEIPVLMLLRQNGKEDQAHGWRGLPFWWPVVVTPRNSVTSVFAAETAQSP